MHFKTNGPGFKIGNFFLQGLAKLLDILDEF